jgi:hypothetical protein
MRSQLLLGVPELRNAPADILDAIDLLASFEAWDRLHRIQQLDSERIAQVLTRTVEPLVAAAARAEPAVS